MRKHGVLFSRITLPVKMLGIALAVGAAIWVLGDYFQGRIMARLIGEQQLARLNAESLANNILFDKYVKQYQQAGKIIVSQARFVEHLQRVGGTWETRPAGPVQEYDTPPPWYPSPSVMRSFADIRYALLLDSNGRLREIFLGEPVPPPRNCLNPG